MNAGRDVLEGADVLVHHGRIVKVGKNLRPKRELVRTIDATGKIVIPGLIHGHLHVCQTLFRNHADGLELLDWLRERIWPFEAAHDAASMKASADLSFLELIKSGSTALLDMGTVHHQDTIFESARDAGIRYVGGKAMMDAGQGVPARLRETTKASLDESHRLYKTWHKTENERLQYAYAPRFVLSCTEDLLREVARKSRELGIRIHTHASENPTECDVVRQKTGKDNIEYFHELGLTGPQLTAAHCVWLTAKEHKLLRETGSVVCHCPSSNLKLASGIAKIPELIAEGVHVCLGADGAPCNNNLDIWMEMRLAALLHKPRMGPLSMPAMKVLEMATIEGARGLGLLDEIGSLEAGKRADLAVVDLWAPHAVPSGGDPVAQLVHAGRASDVVHTVVDGKLVMHDRQFLSLDEPAVLQAAKQHARRLAQAIA